MTIGEKIKELRLYLGMSLSNFGRGLNYSGTQISRFEKNLSSVPEELVVRICEVYKVDRGYFDESVELSDAVEKIGKEDNKRLVGERLRFQRKEKNYTLKKLSSLSEVTDVQICLIEKGESTLTEGTAEKLADVLEVGVEWLLYGDESKKNFPADKKMIDWLWKHPEIREKLWNEMEEK